MHVSIPVPATTVQEWRDRKQKAEEQLTSVGKDGVQLGFELEALDDRLNAAVTSRDAWWQGSKKVSEPMYKLGVGLLAVGAVVCFSGAGGSLGPGLVIGGFGTLLGSTAVNLGTVLVLTSKDSKLEAMGQDRLELLEECRKVAGAEEELKAYDEAVGQTERMLETLKKPTNSVGVLGNTYCFNGVRVKTRQP
jgi:hypothetical protein